MPIWNFAYGSHLSAQQFARVLGGQPCLARRAALPDHALTFWKLTQWPAHCATLAAGGGPALVPAPGALLAGVLYLINSVQFDVVDAYERAWGYVRVDCTVQTDDGPLPAVAHTLPPGTFEPPASEFLQLMLEGLAAHGYGPAEIEAVRRAARGPQAG